MNTRLLAKTLDAVLEPLDMQCLGVEWSPQPGQGRLRVYIERDDRAVTVDDCEQASREISALLDVEDPVPGHYTLEVSSPGVDRPLFTIEQFRGAIGETVNVTLKRALENGRRRLQGKVVSVEQDDIVVEGDQRWSFPYEEVDNARVQPDWQALGMAPKPKRSGRGKRSSGK